MYDLTDKKTCLHDFVLNMLNKTLTMFEYEGLPPTMPAVELEKLLQRNGYAVIAKYTDGQLYAFKAGFAGQDVYGRPTQAIINNPALKWSATLDINKECVVILNNDMKKPITDFFVHYGTLLNENELTMLLSDYNKRIQTLISANDDNTIDNANAYLQKIINGSLGVIGESKLFDSLKIQDSGKGSTTQFTDLVQYQQYLLATLNNEIGLATNSNMKKERLTSNEVDVNQNATYPLVDNMIKNRQNGLELLQSIFGVAAIVKFNSIWSSDDTDRDVDGLDGQDNPDDEPTPDDPDEKPDDPDEKQDDPDDPDEKPDDPNKPDEKPDDPDEKQDDTKDTNKPDEKPDDTDKPDDKQDNPDGKPNDEKDTHTDSDNDDSDKSDDDTEKDDTPDDGEPDKGKQSQSDKQPETDKKNKETDPDDDRNQDKKKKGR